MAIDSQTFKNTLAKWASGVTVVTTHLNGQYHGMTASAFASLSLDPPLILINVGKQTNTHEFITKSGGFAVNIMRSTQLEWGKLFAGLLGEKENQFDNFDYNVAETGAPILPGAAGWLDCSVYATYDGGDHSIFVGLVEAAGSVTENDPLLYFNRQWGEFAVMPANPFFKHVVMFKLADASAENKGAVRDALLGMQGEVPQIRKIEVGENVVESERSYDMVLTVWLDSADDLPVYRDHPAHQKVLNEVIKPRITASIVVDYAG